MANEEQFIFSDLSLSRRLERAEALACAKFVEGRARAFPESDARWIEIAGAYAMFDGPMSPLTQTFGLGLFEQTTESDLDGIELFFKEREAEVFHEVSPLADAALIELLTSRGYRPIEFTSVLFRPIQRGTTFVTERNRTISVRRISSDENDVWASTAAEGWSETPELADFLADLSRVNAHTPDALSFLAELDGRPIATGALGIYDRVALLAGASTIPEARNQGAQIALLNRRLSFAADQGCDIAMMGALPGSASQRNAERQGFRIAYTRIKWHLAQLSQKESNRQ